MKGVSDMKKIIISLVFSVLMTVAGFAQGGTGKFITAFSIDGHSKYHSSSNICFVRDGMDDRFEWRPYGIQDGDSIPNGVFMDIKDVKSIFRHVESDNQLIVNLPEGAPIAKEDISVIAYGKEIKPSRDNHYVTGANTVSVLDKNGRIIYECYISLDTLNAQRSIDVDAMEMAYCLLIPLFPFALDPASDEILSTLKSLLAELSETHMLASAIDNSIVKNGYFEIEDVNAEFEAAIERIIEKLGLRDNYLKQSSKSINPKRANGSTEWGNNLPKLQDGESFYGLKLILDNSEWHAVGDKKWWQCFFTAYNSNRFAYTGWTKGYKDSEGYAHLYDIDYNLLKNRILKPQRVSTFMNTFTSWEGIKNYVSDTYDLLFTEGFGFDDMTWDYTKKSFDINFNYTNEIVVVLGPADDDTMLLYNLIRTFMDPILKIVGKQITKDDDYLMSFIVDLITDTNYMYEFHEIMKKNDSFGVNAREFVKLTWPKAKKHLGDYFGDYFKDELETKQLQYVWDKYGFMAAGDLQETFKVIDENFDFWLKKVEFWGDMFLGNIGLFEGNHYYNLDLNFNYEQANVSKESFTVNGVKFDMVRVPGGSYQMGATGNDKDASSNEKPRHEVSVNNFYIGETEVTQGLWKAVMGSNPSHFNGTELPVENVSWLDCKDFVSRLNELTGQNFRLPTEAEWEYAARGGQNSLGYKYAGSHDINTVGWYKGNSENGTHPVRWKQANELGLYDMSGNVFEWCQDFYDATYYDNSPINDPCNDNVAALYTHVLRGGCWHWDEKYCRVSSRSSNGQNVKSEIFGLRLAMSETQSSFTCPDDHHPHLIDLGLPSGTLWACCNVGSTTPEEYGGYYAWGETETKDNYSWSTYKWCEGRPLSINKYCYDSTYGIIDNILTLELTDDAAYVNWGPEWQMPTKEQQDELRNECDWEWSVVNDVPGMKVKSRTTGSYIFLPAAGYISGSSPSNTTTHGYYQSASLDLVHSDDSYYFFFNSQGHYWQDFSSTVGRDVGFSVRPVGFSEYEGLIDNGDFSSGTDGFSSDYVYVSEAGNYALVEEGRYTIGTSPRDYHIDFIVHGDHTTGTGNMLIVNGSIDNSKYVWKKKFNVQKGMSYEFSAWFLNVCMSNVLDKNMIEYNINGIPITGAYDITENGWDRFIGTFTATETGSIEIKIRSQSSEAGGNDFAIDDIYFSHLHSFDE